jgi:hypothetical protein
MALHASFYTMAIDGINEYLEASENCLNFAKRDDGVLGFPATLLLFCITNALGVYMAGETVTISGRPQRITAKEPFRVFNHELFDLRLEHAQIKHLEKAYRNALAHTAIIDLGASMVAHVDGPVFIFRPQGGVRINLASFQKYVAAAWSRFPKERIKSWADQHYALRRKHPLSQLPLRSRARRT